MDTTAPTVTINQPGGQADPTNISPINFTVTFSEPVTGFDSNDVTLSGTAGATTATVTGGGTTYNVAVTSMARSGTVIATIAAGVASDAASNLNTASTSTDNTVTFDATAPPFVLAPVADTWVQGAEVFRETNYGASAEMQVKRTLNPGAGRGRRGFIRFDTSSVTGTIPSARLRIFARLTDASLPPTNMIVQKVTDTTWSETTMTWNNQPSVESPTALASITVTGATLQFYEFDLTTFIQAERAAGRTAVSFRLINQQPSGNSGAFFTSVNTKEAASSRPQLIIQN